MSVLEVLDLVADTRRQRSGSGIARRRLALGLVPVLRLCVLGVMGKRPGSRVGVSPSM